jgi:thiamine kinase-like enzyme
LNHLLFDLRVLQRVPFLAGRDLADWHVEPIGSVTNQTVCITSNGESYVVRVAGPTTRYLDRKVEAHNTAIAAELGLAPPILYLDETLLVTRFVKGSRPLTRADLDQPAALLQVADILRRLQHSPAPFAGVRHPFGEIDTYLGHHADARATELRTAARPVEEALARSPLGLAPAHVDASAANFLSCADGSLLLVDWEFSSMADPMWDVASVLMQRSGSDDELTHRFVAAVLGSADEPVLARVSLFKIALCLVAGSWCAMEAAFRRDPILADAAKHYLDRCAGCLADPLMAHWLDTASPDQTGA